MEIKNTEDASKGKRVEGKMINRRKPFIASESVRQCMPGLTMRLFLAQGAPNAMVVASTI